MLLHQRIISYLKRQGVACTQKEISMNLPEINRAVLLGYLRSMVDLGKIKSKDSGKAKIYYLS